MCVVKDNNANRIISIVMCSHRLCWVDMLGRVRKENIFMSEKQKKGEKDIRIRTSVEEKAEFKRKAEKRGISVTDFIKERCLKENNGCIYDTEVQQSIYTMCELLYYGVEEHCKDKEFIELCKKGTEKLWQYLQ